MQHWGPDYFHEHKQQISSSYPGSRLKHAKEEEGSTSFFKLICFST